MNLSTGITDCYNAEILQQEKILRRWTRQVLIALGTFILGFVIVSITLPSPDVVIERSTVELHIMIYTYLTMIFLARTSIF